MSLEISRDDKTLFVGGSTDCNIHNGIAGVAAIQFNQYLVHLDTKVIGCEQDLKNVFEIKRFESKKYCTDIDKGVDVLFAACYKSLVIMEWRDHFKKFVELKVIDLMHSAEIFDFVISEEDEIFAISPNDHFISQF
jgi:hypothetical protein